MAWDMETLQACGLGVTILHELEDLTSFMPATVPYLVYDKAPRPLVASNNCLQAICLPYLDSQSVITPLCASLPLVETRVGRLVRGAMMDGHTSCALPGANMMVLYYNLGDNYEDAIVVNRKFVDEGHFAIEVRSQHDLDTNTRPVDVGDSIKRDTHRWWKLPVEGKVTQEYTRDDTYSYVVHVTRIQQLVDGDKLATPHGQKGVARLWSDENMPIGVVDGKEIKFDAVISTSSITNRGTAGQVMEGFAGYRQLVRNRSGSGRRLRNWDSKLVKGREVCVDECSCSVLLGPQKRVAVRSVAGGGYEPTVASFGYLRMYRLTQIVYDKYHYTHRAAGRNMVQPPKGRTRGGAVRLGEMEMMALYTHRKPGIIRDLSDRRSVCVAKVCLKCRRSAWLCTCGNDKSWASFKVPYPLLEYDCIMALTQRRSIEFYTS